MPPTSDKSDDRLPFHRSTGDVPAAVRGEHVAAINQMMSDRGWIVNAYAQVEYLLADTVVRCASVPDYADADTSMPYRLDQRVARFEVLVALPGPLAEQRAAFEEVVAHFRGSEERRQFLVHGLAHFHFTDAGDIAMRFDRFMPTRDEPSRRRSMWFRPATLSEIRSEATAASAAAVRAFIMLHERMGWVVD